MSWEMSAAPGMLGSGRGLTNSEKAEAEARKLGHKKPQNRYDYWAEGYGWFYAIRELADAMGVGYKTLWNAFNCQQGTYQGVKIERRLRG
jgi:hypothetical protein